MKELNYILIITLLILFLGCEEKDKEIPYIKIGSETKDWIFYKANSYWIYQDTNSFQIDSIVIDSSFITILYHNQVSSHDVSYYYDELSIFYNNENYYSLLSEHMSGRSSLTRVYNNGIYYPYFDLEHNELGIEHFFFNKDGDKIGSRTFLNYFDEYTVLENTFDNVFEIKISDSIVAFPTG